MVTPIGASSGTSTGRIERTGAAACGSVEWNSGMSRVLLLPAASTYPFELDEDDVGSVEPDLGMLTLVVGHLHRDGRMPPCGRVLHEDPGQRPPGPRVDRRRGARRGGRGRQGRRTCAGRCGTWRGRGAAGGSEPGRPDHAEDERPAVDLGHA
ncbi:MAG: hypothetical protein V9G19_18420 [Tetrasphaera sp.]